MATTTPQQMQAPAAAPSQQPPPVAAWQWKPAPQPDIVRAAQKDDLYLAMNVDACQAAVMRCCGPVTALHLAREVRLVATFMYYALTSGLGQQTLGEEYCDILQLPPAPLTTSGSSAPSSSRGTRRVFVGPDGGPISTAGVGLTLLQSFGPYLMERLVSSLQGSRGPGGFMEEGEEEEVEQEPGAWGQASHDQQQQQQQQLDDDGLGPIQQAWAQAPVLQHTMAGLTWQQAAAMVRRWLRRRLPALRAGAVYAARLHLAAFYLAGAYYQWSKRLVRVRYTSLSSSRDRQASYEVLGWLLLAQLGVWGVLQVAPLVRHVGPLAGQQAPEQHAAVLPDVVAAAPPSSNSCMPSQPGLVVSEEQPMAPEVPYSSGKQCPLCLSPRSNVTCTPCGHLYCWDCIAAWCLEKPECPLCRAGVVPSQLVCVYHSDL